MKKEGGAQLELFTQSEDSGSLKTYSANKPFLAHIWIYEKTILIIIGLVVTGIISYSLGVERGKGLSILKNNVQVDIQPTAQKPLENVIKEEPVRKETLPLLKQGLIIQLASYKSKASAQKEAEFLKKKGLSPLIVSKGGYQVLCVGNFPNREAAKSILSELKKRYKDCYIRRL